MERQYFPIILLFSAMFFSDMKCSTGQNLALNRPYTLSATPNYSLSAPPGDKTSLTDGVFSVYSRFWTQKTTVGWRNKSTIKIDLDLGSIQPIGTVTFSTAAGTAEVHFPQNIYIFLSNDNKRFEYAGDLMNLIGKMDTSYGTYQKMNFRSEDINRKARYILLQAIPRNKYFFCDEIEVLKADKKISKKIQEVYNVDQLDAITDSLKALEHTRKNLLEALSDLPEIVKKNSGLDDEQIREEMPQNLQIQIGERYGSYLQENLKTSWVVGKLNPWNPVRQFFLPTLVLDTMQYQFSIPVNGVQYGSFTITNTSTRPQEFSVNLNNPDNSISSIKLFEVPFVPVSEGKMIADPLVPASSIIDIPPGLTKLLFFRVEGNRPGTYTDTIRIIEKSKQTLLFVKSQVIDIPSLDKSEKLAANVWAYFTYPMLKNRKLEAVKDLHEHHVNTIVIHSSITPRLNAVDFTKLTDYLKNAGKFEKVLLFENYSDLNNRNGYRGGQFLSQTWKNYFKKWYASILKSLAALGYSADEIYFYPYDEVTGKENIQDFIRFIQWAKANVRDIQFFATLSNEEAIQAITPLVDIAQIHFSNSTSGKLPKHNSQIWTYDAYGSAKTLPAYSYYRLMAWKAFAGGYQGIGFWNYAAGDSNTIDQFFLNPAIDFSAIYTGPDSTIYSSRRWEAFRLGIEDYWILKSYSKKFGYQKAKALVEKVLLKPTDHSLADSIRNEMMSQL